MTYDSMNDILETLITKAEAMQSFLLLDATKVESEIATSSDQTWYGIPEVVIDDLNEAKDLVALALNKIKTAYTLDEYKDFYNLSEDYTW